MGILRFYTAGESHGAYLTAILEGLPAGLTICLETINADLQRRQQGYGRGKRMAIEKDKAQVISGIRFGKTTGAPIAIQIQNRDYENWQDVMAVFGEPAGKAILKPRPGHADYAGLCKYALDDMRNVFERASARETAERVAVGAICKMLLQKFGVSVQSSVVDIGGIDANLEDQVKQRINEAKAAGDTLGGTFRVCVHGLLPGIGSYAQWDRRLDGILAGAMMSIPGIKGVEIGAGFSCANLSGRHVHDEMLPNRHNGIFGILRNSNRAGGFEGGMTNGEDVLVRAAMKPIPTLMTPLRTVNLATGKEDMAAAIRSDVCAVPAAAVVGEAMAAFVFARALCEQFSSDSLSLMQVCIRAYRQYIERLGDKA